MYFHVCMYKSENFAQSQQNLACSVSVTFKYSARKIKFGQVSPKLTKGKDLALGGPVTKEATCLIIDPV